MTINVGDADAKLDYKIYGGDLLISGRDLGLNDDNCFLAVFRSKQEQKTWYAGNLFMRKYYVVFDMTPHTERKENYIQVGIGLQNSKYLVGEELYDPNYKPDVDDDSNKEKDDDQKTADEEVSQDQSVDIDGKDDFHEQKKEKIEADKKEEAAEEKMNGIYLMIGGISLFLVIAGVVFCCIRARQKKNGYDTRTYTEVSDNVRETGTRIN